MSTSHSSLDQSIWIGFSDVSNPQVLAVAHRTGVRAIEVEVICSDPGEHQRRVEHRAADIPDMKLPDWSKVLSRRYDAWSHPHLVVDTAAHTVEQCVDAIRQCVSEERVD
jgi:hypothetical protein